MNLVQHGSSTIKFKKEHLIVSEEADEGKQRTLKRKKKRRMKKIKIMKMKKKKEDENEG